jgi:hypothetical protein
MTSMLIAAAVSGIVAGAEGQSQMRPSELGVSSAQMLGDKHGCKGQNACKGQGGCKSDTHSCKGKNACKGQGGCKG